jgi:prevent-host-death family protein
MKQISVSKARVELSSLVNEVAYNLEQVVLTRHGKPVAAIVPMQDVRTARALTVVSDVGGLDERDLRNDFDQAAHSIGFGEREPR